VCIACDDNYVYIPKLKVEAVLIQWYDNCVVFLDAQNSAKHNIFVTFILSPFYKLSVLIMCKMCVCVCVQLKKDSVNKTFYAGRKCKIGRLFYHLSPFCSYLENSNICLCLNTLLVMIGVLVANKIDLDQRRVISPKSGKEFAESNGLEYFECSAVSIA